VSPYALDDMPSLCLWAVTQNVTRLFYLSSNDRGSGDKRSEVRHIIALNSLWYSSYQLRGPVYKKSYLITVKGFSASLHIKWYDMASGNELQQPWKQLFSGSRVENGVERPTESNKESWIEAYEADNRVASAGSSTGLQASVKSSTSIR